MNWYLEMVCRHFLSRFLPFLIRGEDRSHVTVMHPLGFQDLEWIIRASFELNGAASPISLVVFRRSPRSTNTVQIENNYSCFVANKMMMVMEALPLRQRDIVPLFIILCLKLIHDIAIKFVAMSMLWMRNAELYL